MIATKFLSVLSVIERGRRQIVGNYPGLRIIGPAWAGGRLIYRELGIRTIRFKWLGRNAISFSWDGCREIEFRWRLGRELAR